MEREHARCVAQDRRVTVCNKTPATWVPRRLEPDIKLARGHLT